MLLGLSNCSTKRQMLEKAKTSAYQTDFAVIYSETLDVVTENYPNLVENPAKGMIKTAWHPLSIRNSGHGADAGAVTQTNTGSLPGNNQGLGFGGAGANGAGQTTQQQQQNPQNIDCLLYTSPSPRDQRGSRMPSSA